MGLNNRKCNCGISRLGIILILPFVILALGYIVYKSFFIPDPVIKGLKALEYLSADKTVTIHGENINSIDISIYQNGKKIEILNDTPETRDKIYTLHIKPKELKLTDGRAIILVKATAGFFKEVKYKIDSVIDTVPPDLDVVRAPSVIYQGSAGFALLQAKGADSVFVKLEDKAFRAFEADSGKSISNIGGSRYYVFFPAPFDIKEGSIFYAVAEDAAGNQNVKALSTRLILKKYKESSINISDNFINTVVSSLLNKTNISEPVKAFKKVNEEWRKQSLQKLIDIAKKTTPEILWEGRFLQLRNSKVMATYGDIRTYFYKGKEISKSVHLGYDLASYANAPVEAANSGVVRFTGNLGIYGNTVIIDHGFGLMSLYGHLSSITVSEGQSVKKGEIIATTGSTGLAGGDHLHFGILVHGYEVSPLYWWDPQWIKVNVEDYLFY
jgi:murein DD-endopeptidase MepM/ murein hydrolase activator NlpD